MVVLFYGSGIIPTHPENPITLRKYEVSEYNRVLLSEGYDHRTTNDLKVYIYI